MSTQEFSQEKIRTIGLEALARELGATGLIRFLQIYEQGSGDYTSGRLNILPTQTAAQIAEKIRENHDERS
jgi:hypothetical protein